MSQKGRSRKNTTTAAVVADDRDTPSLRLARSVLRLYTDPGGVLITELQADLGIKPRAFRNYQHRFERVLSEFLPVDAKLEARGRGEARRLHVTTPAQASTQWELVARLAAHGLIEQLLGFMGDAEIARQLHLARTELLGRFEKNLTSKLLQNFPRMFHVLPDAPKDYSKAETIAVINEIVAALTYGIRVRVHYTPPGKPVAVHDLEPLTLGFHRSALYLFARFMTSDKVYNFAVDRISKAQRLVGNYYAYPTSKDWDPGKHFARTFGVFTPPSTKQEAIDVDLVFANKDWLKAHIRERQWMPNQRLDDMSDGRLRLRFTVNSPIELKPWIAQWGKDVEVRAPRFDGGDDSADCSASRPSS